MNSSVRCLFNRLNANPSKSLWGGPLLKIARKLNGLHIYRDIPAPPDSLYHPFYVENRVEYNISVHAIYEYIYMVSLVWDN